MASPVQISVSQLSRLVGTPTSPVLLDVRIADDVDGDPRILPSARQHPFADVAELVPQLGASRVVVYCQKGLKLSEGAAAILRAHGVAAEVLEGGFEAWRDARLPLMPLAQLPTRVAGGHTRWVTRVRPKVDRIACPWLIRRFIDPHAEFLFVSGSSVLLVADRFGAEPLDVEGARYTHAGELCTFDALLDAFDLHTDPLDRLSVIVRGADTNRHDLAPQCAGLLAASLGLSRQYDNDLEQLEAGLTLYDMFYRWARDAVSETHDWPGKGGASR